jgi:hypothetical protein
MRFYTACTGRSEGVVLSGFCRCETPRVRTDRPSQFRPTKFEMTIKLKTANALGISIPPMLLAIADDVIE